jgi:hypothetical protein
MGKKIDPTELDFLLRYPAVLNVVSPVDFLSHTSWGGIKALSNMEQFRNLDRDIEVSSENELMGRMDVCNVKFWLDFPRDQPSAGRSSRTVNVPKRRSFLENGRIRIHFKGCV